MLGDDLVISSYLKMIVFWVFQTRVQASTLTFPEIISKLPQIGVRGVYRGSIPAILGQFSRLSLFLLSLSLSLSPPLLVIFLVLLANLFAWHCSHGLRTGIFEASKLLLINVAPTLPDIQVMVFSLLFGYYWIFYLLSNFIFVLYVPWMLFEKIEN